MKAGQLTVARGGGRAVGVNECGGMGRRAGYKSSGIKKGKRARREKKRSTARLEVHDHSGRKTRKSTWLKK